MTEIASWVYMLGIVQLGILLLGILLGKSTRKFAQDFHRILRLSRKKIFPGWCLNKFFSRIRGGVSWLITLISPLLEKHTTKKSNALLSEKDTNTKKSAQPPTGGAGGGVV